MTEVVRVVATVIDSAAMVGMAALVSMLRPVIGAVRAGTSPPRLRQSWDDLVKLSRKRRLRPGMASPLYAVWPVVALSASAALLVIVPGFAFGLVTAPLARLPIVVGLLAVALGARVAAELESGAGLRGLRAARCAWRIGVGFAVWLVVAGGLALRTGSEAMGAIGGLLAAVPGDALLTVLVGLALALTVGCFDTADPGDYGGPELVLFRVEAALRQVALFAVLLDLVAPLPMADAAIAASWPVGLLAWLVKIAVIGGVLIAVAPRRLAVPLGVAAAVGVVFVLMTQMITAPVLLIGFGLIVAIAGMLALIRPGGAVGAACAVQCGIALVGFGCGATEGAMLIVATVGLAQLAARELPSLALVALLGLPPFGGFAGDVAVLRSGFGVSASLGGAMLAIVVSAACAGLLRCRPHGRVMFAARRTLPAAGLLFAAAALGLMPWLVAVTI